ncbi:myeloid differentiation primary response protein MyD88 isoform X1 [Euwallacea similis]|uniref:myeloid differentiation primary response protein MyD88 isoform X1 n=1 Tax=Euwallacea similis TaxID=1736056 RepID=UPI00344BCF19
MDPSQFETINSISILALRDPTWRIISSLLNPIKLIPTEDRRLRRDWRGLAELCGISGARIPSLSNDVDPTRSVLKLWHEQLKAEATIENFLNHLEEINRFDVKDDISALIAEDIKIYKEQRQNGERVIQIAADIDNQILTTDDVNNIHEGLEPQRYDAFVLFDDDDIQFATELIANLEEKGLKLCVKERDLVGGRCEHDAVIRLIAERCGRVIVIVSSAFLQSNANKFFYSLAQSISIEQMYRKIIPCIYKDCGVLPPELNCYFKLDFRRSGSMWNFWDKLRDSIIATDPDKRRAKLSLPENSLFRGTDTVNVELTPLNALTRSESSSLQRSCVTSHISQTVKFSSNSMSNLPNTEVPEDNIVPSTSTNSLGRYVDNTVRDRNMLSMLKRVKNWVPKSRDKTRIAIANNTQINKPPDVDGDQQSQSRYQVEESIVKENSKSKNKDKEKKKKFSFRWSKKKVALAAA